MLTRRNKIAQKTGKLAAWDRKQAAHALGGLTRDGRVRTVTGATTKHDP